jgi:hypothetical protein
MDGSESLFGWFMILAVLWKRRGIGEWRTRPLVAAHHDSEKIGEENNSD